VTGDPSFLPLTLSSIQQSTGPVRVLRRRVTEADEGAAGCWTALLAGCATQPCDLAALLAALTEAAAGYTGRGWWFGDGSVHRFRIARAQARIDDALSDLDGAEFAEALASYDQAVATAVARVHNNKVIAGARDATRSSTR
jgi:hypothetical protein